MDAPNQEQLENDSEEIENDIPSWAEEVVFYNTLIPFNYFYFEYIVKWIINISTQDYEQTQ